MRHSLFGVAVIAYCVLPAAAHAACESYPYELENGTTANADHVMANFNCAARKSGATLNSSTFTGATSFPGSTTVDSTGNLSVGKSTQNSSLIGVALAIDGSAGFTADLAGGHYSIANSTTGPGMWLQFRNSGTAVGSINIGSSSTSYNTTSDQRLKSPLKEQQNYRSAIQNLWIGDFEWKKDHTKGFGIFAQQTYQYFPEAITRPKNSDEFWQADYSKLSPLALWGVKDLYRENDELAVRIKMLETKLESMERKLQALQLASSQTTNSHAAAKIAYGSR